MTPTRNKLATRIVDSLGYGYAIAERHRHYNKPIINGECFDDVKGYAYDYYNEQHPDQFAPELIKALEAKGFYLEPINAAEAEVMELY